MDWRSGLLDLDILERVRHDFDRTADFASRFAHDLRHTHELATLNQLGAEVQRATGVHQAARDTIREQLASHFEGHTALVTLNRLGEDVDRAMELRQELAYGFTERMRSAIELLQLDGITKRIQEHLIPQLPEASALNRLVVSLSEIPLNSADTAARLESFSASAYAGLLTSIDRLDSWARGVAGMNLDLPSDQIARLVPPSLSLLSDPYLGTAAGVLSPLTDSPCRAFLTWKHELHHDSEWTLESAAWLPKELVIEEGGIRQSEVEVDCQLFCGFCGNGLVKMEETYQHRSDTEIEGSILVVPLCPTCIERAEGPEYWLDKLQHIADPARPSYKLIPGDGEGDGQPAGGARLRLIDADDEEGAEE